MKEDEIIICKWYKPCKYTKWETVSKGECSHGWPVKIQERQCTGCGKIQIRKASIFI